MATLKACNATVVVDSRTGSVSSIVLGRGKAPMTPARPAAFLAVEDLRDGRRYHPLAETFVIRRWKTSRAGGRRSVSFVQQYAGAPLRIAQTFTETPEGVRWDASLRLAAGEADNRSVRVAWALPAPLGWAVWAPQDTTVGRNDGVTPQRYVYGHTSFRPYGTAIPLVATWSDKAGLVAFSPPDVQKPYVSFDLLTEDLPTWVRGIAPAADDQPHLRITYHLVGLRPGKALNLAVCLAGVRPDWRCALGHYVKAYPHLFEPVPATRAVEGMYAITTPTRLAAGGMKRLTTPGTTFAEVHGHFPEYSVFVEPDAIAETEKTWRCKPHPSKPLSVADNRKWIDKLNDAGIAPFMYWYNVHALPETIRRRWPGSTMRDERGRALLKWHTEPSVWGAPDSPFGKHLIRQMDLMLEAYPKMAGLFVDNFAVEMLDFAHDDGVTMVHDKCVYDLNRNHQTIGPICFKRAHAAGKIIMVNKISTIESLAGADMVLAETRGVASVRKHALACVYRPLFPLKMELPEGEHGAERGIQHLLLNGCFPDDALYYADPAAMTAYRPLTDAMIGKRWVLDFDPLTVPAGFDGQVFRIDKAAAHGGTAVVVLADLARSYTEGRFTRRLTVTIRLPEAKRYRRATFLPVERSGRKPRACKMRRTKNALTIHLPPVGAAGIVRLHP